MKPAVRRTLIFMAMVSAGLAVVFSVEEEPLPTRGPAFGTADGAGLDAITIRDPEDGTATQFKLVESSFVSTRNIELPDGRLVPRPSHRIHILGGNLDDSGAFILVDSPHVTLLDPETGAETGSISSEHGRLSVSQMGGGLGIGFQMDAVDSKNFSLTGNVHGEMPLEQGARATFDTQELHYEGDELSAPGEVTLTRASMTLRGRDMRWNDVRQELRFQEIERLDLSGDREAWLSSPRGLTWNAASADTTGGQGRLHGPVTGRSSDGSRLSCETLDWEDGTGAMVMRGEAVVGLVRDGALWNMEADELSVLRSDSGGWELDRAKGHVRLESKEAATPGWFETELLNSRDGQFVAPGPVTGRYGTFDLEAVGLRWHETEGTLDLLADVLIQNTASAEGGPTALAGARISSPGGVFLKTQAAAAGVVGNGIKARFKGPVEGSVPELGSFSCALLIYDEAGRELVLDGECHVEFELPDQHRDLSAGRITMTLDELGAPSAVHARDAVTLVQQETGGTQLTLTGSQLDVTATQVSAPQDFQLSWNDAHITGFGLSLDDVERVFEVARQARITQPAAGGGNSWLEADDGLSWWLPEDRQLGPEAGHGEFRGPVRAQSADGLELSAKAITADGMRRIVRLMGSAQVSRGEDGWVRSEELELKTSPGSGPGLSPSSIPAVQNYVLSSPVAVSWSSPGLSGHGTVLKFDQQRGHFSLERDVLLRTVGSDGSTREIQSDGPFTWASPTGAVDPLSQGVGEFRENVFGRGPNGSGFSADRLLVDMPKKRLELFGECAIQRMRDGKLYTLETDPSAYIRVGLDSFDKLQELEATGRIRMSAGDMKVEANELSWDVPNDHLVLIGDCRLGVLDSWQSSPRLEVWPEALRWFTPQNTSKIDPDR